MTDFERAFKKTMVLEGGGEYVDNPNDPGGETRWGISKRANPDVDIKNLTEEQAKEIYRERYWKPLDFTEQAGYGYVRVSWKLFDIAVNQGVAVALKFKDRIRGLGWIYCLYILCELQMRRYVDIVKNKPSSLEFLKGWTERAFDMGENV